MYYIKNIDNIILATPCVVVISIGGLFNMLEQTRKPVLEQIGWLGRNICVILGSLVGLPLVVWDFVKVLFVGFLNIISGKQSEWIQSVENFCNGGLQRSIFAIGETPLFIREFPGFAASAQSFKDFIDKFQDLWDKNYPIVYT